MSRVIVIGGYGSFGGRLSRRLAEMGFDVVVAGRNLASAQAFCRNVERCRPARVDRREGVGSLLRAEEPDLLIDASGPFQGADYRLVEECIAAGTSYLDLADARDFVTGIVRFDKAAQQAGVAVISGASSVPALSGAVVRHLAEGMEVVTSVEIAISASSRASVGPSVASAILRGVGQPVRLWRGQRRSQGYGWQEPRLQSFRATARHDIGRRMVALADVPDLATLPETLPGRPAVVFRAGTESRFKMVALWLLSWPVRSGWIASLGTLTPLLTTAHRLTTRFGSDRSGMVVRLFGLRDAQRIEKCWSLIAEAGDGPEIPTLAAAILAQRITSGSVQPGARHAGGLLDLEEFRPMLGSLATCQAIEEIPPPPPLYRRVMGDRFDALAPAVRAIHSPLRDAGAYGRGQVERGRNPIARLVAAVMRFPPEGDHPLHVHFTEDAGGERWNRDFGGSRFGSHLSEKRGDLVERFGPMRFHFSLPSEGSGLAMVMQRWSLFGVPLPLALAPQTQAREWEEDGRFRFDVAIDLPLVGRVVRYRGWLAAGT